MRIRHSLKAFVPFILMLAAGQSAQAQYAPSAPSGGMPPSGYNMYQPQSPYQNLFEQTYVSDGLWFRNAVGGLGSGRDFYFDAKYIQTRTRKLDGIFGADGVQTYVQQNDPNADGLGTDLTGFNVFDAATTDLIPRLKTHGLQLGAGFWNADGSGLMLNGIFTPEQTSTFDARARIEAQRRSTLSALSQQAGGGLVLLPGANGGGRTDLDILKNDILAPGVVFDSTNAVSFGIYGSTFDVLDRALMNLYGVPLLHGTSTQLDPGELNGTTVPYDIEFIMQHSIQTMGGSADWAFNPTYERGRSTIRPIFGGRYLQIDETFRFFGEGSILGWGTGDGDAQTYVKVPTAADGIDQDGDFIIDNISEGAGGAGGTVTTFTQPVGPTDLIVESFVISNVESHLAGPQFGFQYDFGDRKGLHISAATRLGLMLNRERIRLRGNNIVDFMGRDQTPDPVTGQDVALRGFDTASNLNAFSGSSTSSHVSPLFEQGINANLPLFRGVPVLKDMWQLEDANLTLGATWMWVGNVADPNQSVLYQSSPVDNVFPTISPDRMGFHQTTLSIGINWNY